MQLTLDALVKAATSFTPMLVPPILSRTGVSILSGDTGAGKSTLALDLVLTLATGRATWHSWPVDDPRPRRVLYLDAENHEGLIARRTLAWLTDRDSEPEQKWDDLPVTWAVEPTFGLGEMNMPADQQRVAFLNRVQRWQDTEGPFDVIVADTLAALSSADDTNSQGQLKRVMDELLVVSRMLDVPVLLIAHPSKEGSVTNRAAMLKGDKPTTQTAVAGSQHVANQAMAVSVMVADGDDVLLAGVKARASETEDGVLVNQMKAVPLGLDDRHGRPISAPVFIDQRWEKREVVVSKFDVFVSWLAEKGDWVRLSECTKENDCPVSRETARRYVVDEEYATQRAGAGLEVQQEPSARGGKPAHIFRIGALQ